MSVHAITDLRGYIAIINVGTLAQVGLVSEPIAGRAMHEGALREGIDDSFAKSNAAPCRESGIMPRR